MTVPGPIRRGLKRLIPAGLIRQRCPVQDRRVALTFDDGPRPGLTDVVLEQLRARGWSATFFLIGERAALVPELCRAIAAAGSELANHSYTHPRCSQLAWRELHAEFERTDQLIRDITGIPTRHVRPPFGTLSPTLLLYLRLRRNTAPVLWSQGVPDEYRLGCDEIVEVFSRLPIRGGDIVLLHDVHRETAKAIPRLFDHLESRGLAGVSLATLLR